MRIKYGDQKRKARTYMPADMYHYLLIEQAGLCALCDKQMIGDGGACADHDKNNPGGFRRLLCGVCNRTLGFVEKPGWLPRALAYIEEHTFFAT